MENEKRQRFLKIAEARTNRVIHDLDLLANCANTNNYAYTQEEVAQMLRSIDEGVRQLKAAFIEKNNEEKKFRFKR